MKPSAAERAMLAKHGITLPPAKRKAKPREPKERQKSAPEAMLELQIRADRLPIPEAEHKFHAGRNWRIDLAWPTLRLGVEIEGGIWTGGRHTRGSGFTADCEKYAELAIAGWRLIRVTPEHIRTGQALTWLKRALDIRVGTGGDA